MHLIQLFPYVWFHPGWRMTAKIGTFFFYGKIQTSLNISINGIQPTCRHQLRVSRGPHILVKGMHLFNLSKMLDELGQIIEIIEKETI